MDSLAFWEAAGPEDRASELALVEVVEVALEEVVVSTSVEVSVDSSALLLLLLLSAAVEVAGELELSVVTATEDCSEDSSATELEESTD